MLQVSGNKCYINHSGKSTEIDFNMRIPFSSRPHHEGGELPLAAAGQAPVLLRDLGSRGDRRVGDLVPEPHRGLERGEAGDPVPQLRGQAGADWGHHALRRAAGLFGKGWRIFSCGFSFLCVFRDLFFFFF